MTTYKEAGVDINIADKAKVQIKKMAASTYNENAFVKPGFFCGGIIPPKDLKEPVLMLSNDGVGTKMMVARLAGKYDTVGIDLVNACANDLVTCGAYPSFFLDYIASEKIDPKIAVDIVSGIAKACKNLGIVLVGGETAQMPGVYVKGEVDIAGTIGGFVEKSEIIDGSTIKEGDVLIGIASSGLHTNGYSLARKALFEDAKFSIFDKPKELGVSIAESLLIPHKDYVPLVLSMKKDFKGVSHITGGGMTDNIPRILPKGLGAKVLLGNWNVPAIFSLIKSKGNVPEQDMLRTFNMGIGLVVAVDKKSAPEILFKIKEKEKAWIIGEVTRGSGVSYVQG